VFNKKYGIGSKETFGQFVERVYRNYVRQNNVNQKTKGIYIRLLKDVLGARTLGDISPQDCRNVQSAFRQKYSASTTNQLMSTASKIFNLAGEEGILDRNPMSFVKRLKEPPSRDRLLSKEEWERLWRELDKDSLLKRLVILALNLPLRRGQFLAITPDAVNLSTGLLMATESKGRPPRLVPCNSTVMHTLMKMLEDEQLPFPVDPRKRWERALRKASITNFRFHDLRKQQATNLINNGVNPEIVRQLFGHSAMKITQKYMVPELTAMAAGGEDFG
jgi:integrase